MKAPILFACLLLASCSTPAENARVSAIVDLALRVAVRKGAITEADANDVREAKTIVLDETATSTTTGK